MVHVCAYCGLAAESVDHIPPVKHMDWFLPDERYCVPACKECNGGLGDRFLLTFTERLEFIKVWLRLRYARELKTVVRSPEELKEYGPTLRKKLEKAGLRKTVLQDRLEYLAIPPRLAYRRDSRFI